MHLSQAWLGIAGLARDDRSSLYELLPDRAGVAGASPVRDVADLGDVTTRMVRADLERQLSMLADRIEACAKQYFADRARQSPDERRPWLIQGITLPLAAFTGHLLNETVVHGYDIARAAGRPWRINPAHAAMLMDRFFIPLIKEADPRALVNADTAAGLNAIFDVRIRGAGRFLSFSTTGRFGLRRRRAAESTAISRPTRWRSCWCSGTGRASGRRSPGGS
jgi:hypothetical protein